MASNLRRRSISNTLKQKMINDVIDQDEMTFEAKNNQMNSIINMNVH